MVVTREAGDRSHGPKVSARVEQAEVNIGPREIVQMAESYVGDVINSLNAHDGLETNIMRSLRGAALEIRGLPTIHVHSDIFGYLLNNLDATEDTGVKKRIASQAVSVAVGFLDQLNSPLHIHPVLHDPRVTIPDLHGLQILDLIERGRRANIVESNQVRVMDRVLDQVISRAPVTLKVTLTRKELLGLDHEGFYKFKSMADYRMPLNVIRAEFDHPTRPQVARVLERSFGAATVYFPSASFDQSASPLLDAVNLGNLARSDHPLSQWIYRLRQDMCMDEFILVVIPFSGHGSKADRYELMVFYRNRLNGQFEQSSTVVTVNPPWIPDEPEHHGFLSVHPYVRFWGSRR